MTWLTIAGAGLLLIAVVLLGAFIFLGLPIWAIVVCTMSSRRWWIKGVWIGAIVTFGPVSAMIYGLTLSESRRLRWGSATALVFAVAAIVGVVAAMPRIVRATGAGLSQAVTRVEQVTLVDVTGDQRHELEMALRTLQQELDAPWYASLERVQRTLGLHELLRAYLADDRLTGVEYQDWRQMFQVRGSLDPRALQRHIRTVQRQP